MLPAIVKFMLTRALRSCSRNKYRGAQPQSVKSAVRKLNLYKDTTSSCCTPCQGCGIGKEDDPLGSLCWSCGTLFCSACLCSELVAPSAASESGQRRCPNPSCDSVWLFSNGNEYNDRKQGLSSLAHDNFRPHQCRARAHRELGALYGQCCTDEAHDATSAARFEFHLEKAVDLQDPLACVIWNHRILTKPNKRVDNEREKQALACLKQSANDGMAFAHMLLADVYQKTETPLQRLNGHFVEKYLLNAAQHGCAITSHWLGRLYELGSIRLMKMSLPLNLRQALNNLETACTLYKTSSQCGCTASTENLRRVQQRLRATSKRSVSDPMFHVASKTPPEATLHKLATVAEIQVEPEVKPKVETLHFDQTSNNKEDGTTSLTSLSADTFIANKSSCTSNIRISSSQAKQNADQAHTEIDQNCITTQTIPASIPADPQTAATLYRRAAEKGDNLARTELGKLLLKGAGVQKNIDKAISLFLRAAEQHHAAAMTELGHAYANGLADEIRGAKNYVSAAKWYRKATNAGDPVAQCALGVLYIRGHGVPKNPKEAIELFKQACNARCPVAFHNLGVAYLTGIKGCIERNPKLAATYFRDACAYDFTSSQFNLGMMNIHGDGVTRDFDKGVRCIKDAAANGNGYAHYVIAWLLVNGTCYGVMPDWQKAKLHLRKASSSGVSCASKMLDELHEFEFRSEKVIERPVTATVVQPSTPPAMPRLLKSPTPKAHRRKVTARIKRIKYSTTQKNSRVPKETMDKTTHH